MKSDSYKKACETLIDSVEPDSFIELFAGDGQKTIRPFIEAGCDCYACEIIPERREKLAALGMRPGEVFYDYESALDDGGEFDIVSCDAPFILENRLGCTTLPRARKIARDGLIGWLPSDIPKYMKNVGLGDEWLGPLLADCQETFDRLPPYPIHWIEYTFECRVVSINDPMTGVIYYGMKLDG